MAFFSFHFLEEKSLHLAITSWDLTKPIILLHASSLEMRLVFLRSLFVTSTKQHCWLVHFVWMWDTRSGDLLSRWRYSQGHSVICHLYHFWHFYKACMELVSTKQYLNRKFSVPPQHCQLSGKYRSIWTFNARWRGWNIMLRWYVEIWYRSCMWPLGNFTNFSCSCPKIRLPPLHSSACNPLIRKG